MNALVGRAQAAAERIMVDACDVTRGTGEGYWDDATGQWVEGTPATVWSGPCRVRSAAGQRDVEAGEQEIGVTRWEVHVPVEGTGGITRGDTVTVTASGDPGLMGAVFTVSGPAGGSMVSARRLPVERVS